MRVEDVIQQMNCVHDLMKRAMTPDDFGTIPGCGDKPALKKPGAEKLNLLFRLAPTYEVAERAMGGEHREYRVTCTLTHIPTGQVYGQGEGLCSTMESKYRWRKGERKCPTCGKACIIKGKAEYGGGWLCYAKKGGCGTKFNDGDKAIESQDTGRTENPDIADQYNTVLKMSCKRAMVAATLNATGASALFTQDIDEMAPEPAAVDGDAAMDAIVDEKPKAGTPKKTPSTTGQFDDVIVKVTPKTMKNGKTFWLIDTKNGTTLATFSSTDKDNCELAMADDVILGIAWEDKDGKGKILTGLYEAVAQ
jgi:hypothetical protein